MGVSEGVPAPTHENQNGRNHSMSPKAILDGTAEIFGAGPDNARGREADAPALSVAGEGEVGTARRNAESLGARAQVEAEELLSRAHAHANVLRVHAEAARAEAQALRAEAAALRRASADQAAAATSFVAALTAEMEATAKDLRSSMESKADEARAEVERLGREAMSLRRLLRAEIDAGLADIQQMRAEVQGVWAETEKQAAGLRLLSARAGAAVTLDELRVDTTGDKGLGRSDDPRPSPAPTAAVRHEVSRPGADTRAAGDVEGERRTTNGRLDDFRRAIAVEVEQRLAQVYAETGDRREGAGARTGQHHDGLRPQIDVGGLLREIWDAAYAELAPATEGAEMPSDHGDRTPPGSVEAPPTEHPDGRHTNRSRAFEPLIGSGGWRAGRGPGSDASTDDPVHPAPPSPGVDRPRRFRRTG